MAEPVPTGELMALALERARAEPLFTLNGGHIWGLYLGAQRRGLRMVDTRHEQTAGFAAEGWARVTRGCGVAAITAGPGVTNAMSAIATARQNDSPVLFLGGRAPVSRWGMGSLQELDHLPLVASLTKSAATVETPDSAYAATVRAIATARSGRTGPAFLDVPVDVFFGSAGAPGDGAAPAVDRGPEPDPDQVRRVVDLLQEAERPAM